MEVDREHLAAKHMRKKMRLYMKFLKKSVHFFGVILWRVLSIQKEIAQTQAILLIYYEGWIEKSGQTDCSIYMRVQKT